MNAYDEFDTATPPLIDLHCKETVQLKLRSQFETLKGNKHWSRNKRPKSTEYKGQTQDLVIKAISLTSNQGLNISPGMVVQEHLNVIDIMMDIVQLAKTIASRGKRKLKMIFQIINSEKAHILINNTC